MKFKSQLRTTLALGVILGSGAIVSARDFTAEIYSEGSQRHELLFNQTYTETKGADGTIKGHSSFKDPGGKEAVSEDIERDAHGLKHYYIHQSQLEAEGKLEIRDGKSYFSWQHKGDDPKTNDEKFTDNLIVGPTTTLFIEKNWAQIQSGKTADARFASLDRRETVGFGFSKDKDDTFDGKPAVKVKMKASSFLIAAIVKPLFFTFTPDGSTLLTLTGRTLPKRHVQNLWKDLDAEVVYHFKN